MGLFIITLFVLDSIYIPASLSEVGMVKLHLLHFFLYFICYIIFTFIHNFFFLHSIAFIAFAELSMEAAATATVLTPPSAPPRPSVFLRRPSALAFPSNLAFSTKVSIDYLFIFLIFGVLFVVARNVCCG